MTGSFFFMKSFAVYNFYLNFHFILYCALILYSGLRNLQFKLISSFNILTRNLTMDHSFYEALLYLIMF